MNKTQRNQNRANAAKLAQLNPRKKERDAFLLKQSQARRAMA